MLPISGVVLGPSASAQWRDAPEHLAMVLARYRAASALIGSSRSVAEFGCGEGIGARILASGRERYTGFDRDADALDYARWAVTAPTVAFHETDVLELGTDAVRDVYDAIVALDVIEHLSESDGRRLVAIARGLLRSNGVLVIGTPSRRFDHLASAQSRAAHVRTYLPAELDALLFDHFRLVQSFGMQDTGLHLGHPDARHYLLGVGVIPR